MQLLNPFQNREYTSPGCFLIVCQVFMYAYVFSCVVDNTMWDPLLNASFSMADAAANKDARWWWGEPVWVTAVKQV